MDARNILTSNRRELFIGAGLTAAAGLLSACSREAVSAEMSAPAAQDGLARLDLRENPWGCSPEAVEAVLAHADALHLNRYAGDEKQALISHIATQNGLTDDQIVLGNGSKPILSAMGAVLARKGGDLVTADRTYKVLYESAEAFGANLVQIPLNAEHDWDFATMADKLGPQTCGVYLCNPNGSTGRLADHETLKAFVIQASEFAPVVVDEAYIDMTPDYPNNSMVSLVAEGRNVVVSRTLSKKHGLAGQRLGYAMGPPELVELTHKLLTNHVNRAGLVAGLASLQDTGFQSEMVTRFDAGRARLVRLIDAAGFDYVPGTMHNGVSFNAGMEVEEFHKLMMAENILTPAKGDPRFPGVTGLCVGTEPDMDRLETALKKIVAA